jgi:hypothetical protein
MKINKKKNLLFNKIINLMNKGKKLIIVALSLLFLGILVFLIYRKMYPIESYLASSKKDRSSIMALKNKDNNRLERILQEGGVDPNQSLTTCTRNIMNKPFILYKVTLLMYAVMSQNTVGAKILLKYGADPNLSSEYLQPFETYVKWIELSNGMDILLLAPFIDRPIPSFYPLFGAILQRDVDMVKLLCEFGANPNQLIKLSFVKETLTPLTFAIKYADTLNYTYVIDPNIEKVLTFSSIANVLLKNGANVSSALEFAKSNPFPSGSCQNMVFSSLENQELYQTLCSSSSSSSPYLDFPTFPPIVKRHPIVNPLNFKIEYSLATDIVNYIFYFYFKMCSRMDFDLGYGHILEINNITQYIFNQKVQALTVKRIVPFVDDDEMTREDIIDPFTFFSIINDKFNIPNTENNFVEFKREVPVPVSSKILFNKSSRLVFLIPFVLQNTSSGALGFSIGRADVYTNQSIGFFWWIAEMSASVCPITISDIPFFLRYSM